MLVRYVPETLVQFRQEAPTIRPHVIIYGLKELEEEDCEVDRIARRLYHADLSKMPPFDVAISTDRVPPDKAAKIVAVSREEKEQERKES